MVQREAAQQRAQPAATPIVRRPKVRARNRRRVLDAAKAIVAVGGLDALSMRNLADRAGVSATTLYNLFGTKDAVVHALATDALAELDVAFEHTVDPDPIVTVRLRVLRLVDLVVDHVAPSLVSAVLEDAVLTEQLNAQWRSHSSIENGIREAMARGQLDPEFDPSVLAEHIRAGLLHQQRLWAAGVTDDATYRAAALYCVDVALFAIARGRTRTVLRRSLREAERALRTRAH